MQPNATLKEKIINLIKNYGFLIFSYILFFFLLALIKSRFPQLGFENYEQSELNKLLSENPLKLLFLVLVMAPVLEETIFRSLIKPSKNEVLLFLCTLLLILTSFLVPNHIYWLIKYSFYALLYVTFFLFLKELIPDFVQSKIVDFLNSGYKFIWIFTSILFGLVHILNYVEDIQINLVLFLLIFPRIIAGFFLGKIKVENKSIAWSMLFHAMNNASVVFVIFPKLMHGI